MALSETQDWIIRELGLKGGTIEGRPTRADLDEEILERAIDGLRQRRYIEVFGPPNANSYLGKDIDELRLLPYGSAYLRTLRR